MRKYYIIALLFAFAACRPSPRPAPYADMGRLNFPGGAWEPVAVAVVADGTVYVADDSMANAVQVFDRRGLYRGAIGGIGKTPGRLLVPVDVAVAPSGAILVADFGNRRISEFGPDGKFRRLIGEGVLRAPLGVGADTGGNVYVADADAGGVLVFGPDGRYKTTWAGPEGGARSWDVAGADDGRVAVVAADESDVSVVDGAGRVLAKLEAPGTPAAAPVEAAFGSHGETFVLFQKTDAGGADAYFIVRFSRAGTPLERVEVATSSPTGLAAAADGTLYVADGPRHQVRVFKRKPPEKKAGGRNGRP